MRRYTSEFRESAVNMVLVEGLSVARAAAALGGPVNTLHGWIAKSERKTGPFMPQPERDMAAHVRQLEAENRTLRTERDIQKDSDGALRQGAAVKFAWIRDALVPEFAVRDCCRVLKVSASGYYRWLKAPVSERTIRRRSLLAKIRAEHAQSKCIYGSPTIHERLALSGVRVYVKTVADIMRAASIRSRTIRKFRPSTTQSRHGHEPAPNNLERDLSATGPDQKSLSDITYIRTGEGFLYLACVMDVWSRSIVGWSMSDTLHSTAAIDAVGMAFARRRPGAGLVFHSHRGVQFACRECRQMLQSRGRLLRNRHDGEPLGNTENRTDPTRDICEARRRARRSLRVDRGLVPPRAFARLTWLSQPRSVRGRKESWLTW